MKQIALVLTIIGFSYFGVIFILALISFIADHLTKDESQRYEEYWRDKNTDTK
jgi:hypothetical protein